MRYISLIISMLCIASAYADNSESQGSTCNNPLILESAPGFFIATGSANTQDWGKGLEYGQEIGQSIYWKVNLPECMSMVIHTYGSELLCTRILVIAPDGSLVARARESSEYYHYCDSMSIYSGEPFELTHDCYVAFDLPPGEYEISASGYRYYNGNAVNGPIKLTVIGFGNNIAEYKNIPKSFIPGTPQHPFPLGDLTGNNRREIHDTLTTIFYDTRKDIIVGPVYEFNLRDTTDITVKVLQYDGRPNLSTTSFQSKPFRSRSEILPPPAIRDSIFYGKNPPGNYLLTIAPSTVPPKETQYVSFEVIGEIPQKPVSPGKYPAYDINISLTDPTTIGRNYVITRSMLNVSSTMFTEDVAYVDGLGRPIQTSLTESSSEEKSIVNVAEYDSSGLPTRFYLPTVSNGGYCCTSDLDFNSVYGNDKQPYSQTIYEQSPLKRPLMQYGAGERWHVAGRSITYEYRLNSDKEGELSCLYLNLMDDNTISSRSGSRRYYDSGQLDVTRVINEDGNESLTFFNHHGNVVLKRHIVENGYADTYYIYDNADNLRVVIPPEASTHLTGTVNLNIDQSEIISGYCFVYTYDELKQMTSMKVPGCERVIFRYDESGRQFAFQDGELRRAGRWRFCIADNFGREAVTGTCSNFSMTGTSAGLVRARRSSKPNALAGYDIDGASVEDAQVLTANFYDDYSFIDAFALSDSLLFIPTAESPEYYHDTKGQLTGRIVAVPVEPADDSLSYLVSAVYYDHRDRQVQIVSQNRFDGFDRTSIAYDFAGRPVESALVHSAVVSDSVCRVIQQWRREFDDRGRELSVQHCIDNGEWQLLSQKKYDAVGRLASERIGGADVTIGYDIRSRPVSMMSERYRQQLVFTFGGNVSRMTWWVDEPNPEERSYDFSYDSLERLTAARYGRGGSPCWFYDTDYTYDLSGNLTTLRRNGLYSRSAYGNRYSLIDDLTFEYKGNSLVRVTDASSGPYFEGAQHFFDGADKPVEYTYNANGAIDADLNRGIITTRYDVGGRPQLVSFASGAQTAYIYSAEGVKLQTRHHIPAVSTVIAADGVSSDAMLLSVTDYCGPMVYEDGHLDRIQLETGYLSFRDEMGNRLEWPQYHFFLRDHLGNNRVDFTADGCVWQTTHYYPFGLAMGDGFLPGRQRWTFGGKEMDRVAGLDLLDFDARSYCPALGRFCQPDPLSPMYYSLSPYAFCLNSPLSNTDPSGMIVRVLDESSRDNILNTIGRDEAKYVSFNDNIVEYSPVNIKDDPSENMKALLALINSDIEYIFMTTDTYPVGDKNYKLQSNPIDGVVGVTLIPDAEKDPSPDNNVYIYTSSSLTKEKQVSNTAHEAYGHAYFYELYRLGYDVNPFHTYEFISLPKEIDPVDGSVSFPFIKTDTNSPLKYQIKKSEKEAIKNYRSRINP